MNELLAKLSEPFPPSAVTWKPGMAKENKCLALAYADLRAYQERLDEVCGLDWSVRYLPWDARRIICELTIAGVTRSSTGEMDAQDEKNNMGGTVAEAQAMKRAAAQFGLGRYLYDLPSVWVEYDAQSRRISANGQAQLDSRYKVWYAKTTAAQSKPATHNGAQAPQTAQDALNGSHAPDVRYADLIDSLTGDCLARANRARLIHAQSNGPASLEQYRFLAGTIDALVRQPGAHRAILEVFVGRAVSSDNPPGAQLAGKLLDALLEERTVEVDGEKVKEPNPLYNPDAVTCIHAVWRLVREADGQASLFEQPVAA